MTSLCDKLNLKTVTQQDNNWMVLNLMADWKFFNLRKVFPNAVGTRSYTLLVYLDVVCSNVVGDDTEHPLVREVVYK